MDVGEQGGTQMAEPLPIVLVPGLLTSPRLYAEQLPALWQHGLVTITGNTRDDTIAAIASRILADAPPRFALAGLSMGGYICFELARQAPDRVARLALLDTTARPDTPELTQRRRSRSSLLQAAASRARPTTAAADSQLLPTRSRLTRESSPAWWAKGRMVSGCGSRSRWRRRRLGGGSGGPAGRGTPRRWGRTAHPG